MSGLVTRPMPETWSARSWSRKRILASQQASLWLGALDPLRGWMEGWASRDRPGETMDVGIGSATGWLGGFTSAAQPL